MSNFITNQSQEEEFNFHLIHQKYTYIVLMHTNTS